MHANEKHVYLIKKKMWIHQVSANSELEGKQLVNQRGLSLSMTVVVTLNPGLATMAGVKLIQPAACVCIAHEVRMDFACLNG